MGKLEDIENEADNNDGWVEWPSFEQNEEGKFDWSLSYEEMDKLYNPAKKHKVRRFNYNSSSSFPRKEFKQTSPLPQPRIMSHRQWKQNKPIIEQSVKKPINESHSIAYEKSKVEIEAKERNLFISNMTTEQYRLMQKHGWRVAKALTDPEPNFHIPG